MDLERTMLAIAESYCEQNGIPIRARTSEAERDAALESLVQSAKSIGYHAGKQMRAPSLCPYADGALADAWQAGRLAGIADLMAGKR